MHGASGKRFFALAKSKLVCDIEKMSKIGTVLKKNPLQLNASALLSLWGKISPLPGGKTAFSRLLGFFIPYTGRLGARIEELSPGRAVVSVRECRQLRNHLRSMHAMALANLGELASGLALHTAIPLEAQAILTSFSITYLKKARGHLVAQSACEPIQSAETREVELMVSIRNEAKEEVAQVHAWWRVGARRKV
jgi:acyl-coenzyme A thioesterase PaaI-like protein